MSFWWQQSIFYHIYPLGFCACPPINPLAQIQPNIAQIQPLPRLTKIRKYYSHFQKLNIQAIYFGPIFESCTHGYDTINYFQIDRRLGSNQLFLEIVNELHQLGIKVIIDAVFNHTSRLFPPFINLKQRKSQSPFLTWYKNVNFNQDNIWQDGFSYQHYQDCVELPELNLANPQVQQYFLSVIQYWFQYFHIDGLRLDVAYLLPPPFITQINTICHDLDPNPTIIGEIMSYDHLPLIQPNLLHTGTNYPFYQHLHQSFTQNDFWQLKNIIEQQSNPHLFNFLNNHDTNRIFSQLEEYHQLQSAFVILMTTPGQPCLYYGDEFLLDGLKSTRHDQQVRNNMPLPNKISLEQKKHLQFIKQLTNLRRQYSNIFNQPIKIFHCQHQSFGYLLSSSQQSFFIVINNHPSQPLPFSALSLPSSILFDCLTSQKISIDSQTNLPPQSFCLLSTQPT